ncbi:MAG: hypothetical protein QOI12_4588 [Alphaproteobacteria bacterium]|jgi:AcrR family transcriptional regulator|nr:hypothetical protein [Alphaproteobacteria bacterium]
MPRRIPVTTRQSPYAPPGLAQITKARAMYVEGFTVSRILAACDMSLGTLYYWLDGGPREADGPRLPPIPRRRTVVGKRRPPLCGDQVALVARLWRTAERQVRDIELRLARADLPGTERERDTRMLAGLVRMLRDLSGFAAVAASGGKPADDDPVPADVDEFRAALARRIEAFVRRNEDQDGDEDGAARPAQSVSKTLNVP